MRPLLPGCVDDRDGHGFAARGAHSLNRFGPERDENGSSEPHEPPRNQPSPAVMTCGSASRGNLFQLAISKKPDPVPVRRPSGPGHPLFLPAGAGRHDQEIGPTASACRRAPPCTEDYGVAVGEMANAGTLTVVLIAPERAVLSGVTCTGTKYKERASSALSLSLSRDFFPCPADVAQLVAHPTCNRAVRGSSPLVGSIMGSAHLGSWLRYRGVAAALGKAWTPPRLGRMTR